MKSPNGNHLSVRGALQPSDGDPLHGAGSPIAATKRLRPGARGALFALIAALCLGVAATAVVLAVGRSEPRASAGESAQQASRQTIAAIRQRPHIVFRHMGMGDDFGTIALAPLSAPAGSRARADAQCARLYVSADRGICLGGSYALGGLYRGYVLDRDLQPQHSFPLTGLPSRARISPDGRYGSVTVFVTGHSYADGAFSTETTLLDMASGTTIGHLEQFSVERDGAPFWSIDFNFWGVTFARDSNRFYATLASGGKTYLVEGDVAERRARVLHENVECPSLSPDNERLAYKKRVERDGVSQWQLSVLDLATMVETELAAETRNIDDQVEWLDDQHILYASRDPGQVSEHIWMLAIDGGDRPRLLIPDAASPTVIRP